MLWELIKYLFNLGNHKTIYGSARWLTGIPKWNLLSKHNHGFVIDGINRISLERSFRHLLITSPTGGGKTTIYHANLLNMTGTSFLATDPAGELYSNCRGYLQSMGYSIKVLNLSTDDPTNSVQYNPLHRCETFTEIQKLATILVDAANQNSRGDVFWLDSAKNLISILLRGIKKLPEECRNLGELFRLLNMFGHKQEEVNKIMAKVLDDHSFEEYKAVLSNEDRVLSSIVATCKAAMHKFSDPHLRQLTQKDTLELESLRKEKKAIFITVDESEISYYSFILNIFYTQAFTYLMKLLQPGQPYNPVFLFIDEFANSGKLLNFSTLITVMRKRKVGIMAAIQNLEQLQFYGRSEGATIYNNFTSKLFLPGLPLSTCEEVSKMLGNKTLSYREIGYKMHRTGFIPDRDRDVSRALLTPDEIRTLKKRMIFIHGEVLPVKLKPIPWYRNRELIRRSKIR